MMHRAIVGCLLLILQVRLDPTSDGTGGVQVQDWEIGYSCPDAECAG